MILLQIPRATLIICLLLNVVQDDTESVVNEGEDGNEQIGPLEREVAKCPAVCVEKSQKGEYELQRDERIKGKISLFSSIYFI